jgi:hypothetical protein
MCLFIALGIYLGSKYTANLGTLKGSNANLGVLLFFIIFSTWAILELSLLLYSKSLDRVTATLMRSREEHNSQSRELGNYSRNIGPMPVTVTADRVTSDTGDAIREALRASIHAQEESVKAQTAILELLDLQSEYTKSQSKGRID